MKKLAIAALMMVTFAGASFAQTAPAKKSKSTKMEAKKDEAKAGDTATHKHAHKGTKHAKA